jgi:hypothetical protein
MREHALQPGHILTGALFNEPMWVETVRAHGAGVWEVGLVGIQLERFKDSHALVIKPALREGRVVYAAS